MFNPEYNHHSVRRKRTLQHSNKVLLISKKGIRFISFVCLYCNAIRNNELPVLIRRKICPFLRSHFLPKPPCRWRKLSLAPQQAPPVRSSALAFLLPCLCCSSRCCSAYCARRCCWFRPGNRCSSETRKPVLKT